MKKKDRPKKPDAMAAARRHEHEAAGGVAGALTGSAIGAIVGPPGAVAGAVIGGIVGAVAVGVVEKNADDRAALERELDDETAKPNDR